MIDLPSGFVSVEEKNITNVGALEEFVDTIVKVTTLDDMLLLANSTRVMVFPSNSFSESNVTTLNLSGFSNLEGIEVGDNSFTHVNHVLFARMDSLMTISIGKGSFSDSIMGFSLLPNRSMEVSECIALKRLIIGDRSFSSYDYLIAKG